MAKAAAANANDPKVKASREIGRAYYYSLMKQNNPSMSKEDLASGWKENRKTYIKLGRQVLNRLEKRGVSVTPKA